MANITKNELIKINADLSGQVERLTAELAAVRATLLALREQGEHTKRVVAKDYLDHKSDDWIDHVVRVVDSREEAAARRDNLAAKCAAQGKNATVRYAKRGEQWVVIAREYH